MEILHLPERDCLVAEVHGSYDQISAAHDLIDQRIASEGLRVSDADSIDGRAFNIYLTTPDEVSEDQLVTLVHEPLSPVQGG